MYYPYLRGKQFELLLLRDNAQLLATNDFHPIIEPVKKDFKALIRALDVLNKENIFYTLIINPKAGAKPINEIKILEELINDNLNECENISLGYILDANTKISHLVKILKTYSALNFSLIHYGFANGSEIADSIKNFENIKRHIFIDRFTGKLYQRHLKKEGVLRILLRDGFNAQRKNSLYPTSEHFSDLHITYPDEGMDGFGDFLIVGDDYTETGGPAYAVAIHLTYLQNDDDMHIYHFVSDQTDSPTDPGGKFLEALRKLDNEVRKNNSLIFKSNACKEYLKLYKKKHYPGLGHVKKLSMQHHIELIAKFNNR